MRNARSRSVGRCAGSRRGARRPPRLGFEGLEGRRVLAAFVSGPFGWAGAFEQGPAGDPANAPSAWQGTSSTAVDSAGNVYVAGTFYDGVDFDMGAGSGVLAAGRMFVAKYSPAGALRWARQVDAGLRNDPSIAITSTGDVVVAGSFDRESDFDPGPGVHMLKPTGYIDGFVLNLNASGGFRWAKRFGGDGNFTETFFSHVLADAAGGIYVAGSFNGLTNLGLAAGYRDAVLLKLDGAGTKVWSRQVGAAESSAYGQSVERDAAGGVYLAGGYSGTVDLNPGVGVVASRAAPFSAQFLVRLSADGGYTRSFTMPGDSGLEVRDVEVAPDGSFYVGGHFNGTVDLGGAFGASAQGVSLTSESSQDAFLAKLSPSGSLAWAWRIGDYSGPDTVARIVANASGAVFVGGSFCGDVDFDRGPGIAVLQSATNWSTPSAFLLRMNAGGTFVTVRRYGSQNPLASVEVKSMAVAPGGSVFWAGSSDTLANTGGLQVDPDGGGAILQRATVAGTQPPITSFLAKESFAPGVFVSGRVWLDGLELGSTSLGYAVRPTGKAAIQVTTGGQPASRTNPGAGWIAIGARAVGSGYELLWRNTQSGGYAIWTLDAAGRQTATRATTLGDVYSLEKQHFVDFTGEGRIGAPTLPFTAQRRLGVVEFGTTAAGYALRVNSRVLQVSFSGGYASATRPGSGWVARAARRLDTGYELLWRNTQAGGWVAWTLDADGARTAERSLRLVDVYALERQFNTDITGDGRIGAPA